VRLLREAVARHDGWYERMLGEDLSTNGASKRVLKTFAPTQCQRQ
jgi:hypothetical protein